ncbi:ribonuclease H-like domain-containing protein [Tanacetum coccineum]
MVTRFRVGSNRLPKNLNIHVSTIPPYLHRIQMRLMIQIGKMFFWHKHLAYGTLSRYKACLVVNGSTQLSGIDVDETFNLVVKPATIRIILSLATSRHWLVHQLDVNNAFYETSLYGLKQTPRAWFQRFAAYVTRIINSLHQEFSMIDLGSLNCFLGHVYTESKVGADGDPVSDLKLYRSLAGALQYLTFTPPDISYSVQQVYLYMHDPREPHSWLLSRFYDMFMALWVMGYNCISWQQLTPLVF